MFCRYFKTDFKYLCLNGLLCTSIVSLLMTTIGTTLYYLADKFAIRKDIEIKAPCARAKLLLDSSGSNKE